LNLFVGCAGWSVPKQEAQRFPSGGTHLERYAQRFGAVEINSSFYRSHRPGTYARWAASVPDHFRFAVKVPKEITHVHRLAELTSLDGFLVEASGLGQKLGPLLVQLPPSLAFDAKISRAFFEAVRKRFGGAVVLEPRHQSWFEVSATRILESYAVARAATDPAVVPEAARPGAWAGLVYYRLHGSPHRYHSAYSPDYLTTLSQALAQWARSVPTWCIFDNTAEGAATKNALAVGDSLGFRSC
jgi:uncharacterized protein YecE (DUF72 family)